MDKKTTSSDDILKETVLRQLIFITACLHSPIRLNVKRDPTLCSASGAGL